MSLVGDIIMELRQRIPDAPPVLNPCNILGVSTGFTPGVGWVGGSTQYIAATATNTWGETVAAPQSPITVTLGPNDNTIFVQIGAAPPPLYQNINIYQTGSAGVPFPSGFLDQFVFPVPPGQYIFTCAIGPGSVANHTGGPPSRATAFNPDNDGNFIGAYTAYRLLNRALQEMVRIAGGIIDVTGVQSQINQSMYRLASPFYQFVNAWFDGYPMDVVPRSMMYLRNSAAGFSGILSYEQDGPQSVIQVWPQSNRTGGQAELVGQIFEDTPNFFAVNASGFLSIGLVQVDNEVMAYSKVSPVQSSIANLYEFSGVTRGMGGTDAVTHTGGAFVTELNIRMSGYRMARTYSVGDALLNIQVPQAWETPLVLHMLSQVRSMEQDEAASKQLLGDFVQMADKISKQSRMGKMKPRQIPIWGQNSTDARNVNGIGFGWLIN